MHTRIATRHAKRMHAPAVCKRSMYLPYIIYDGCMVHALVCGPGDLYVIADSADLVAYPGGYSRTTLKLRGT